MGTNDQVKQAGETSEKARCQAAVWLNDLLNVKPGVARAQGKSADLPPPELGSIEKAAIAMLATGMSMASVAKTLDLEEYSVQALIKRDDAIELLCKIQDGLGLTAEERLAKAANMAVAKQIALINSDNERIAGEAARYVLDQAMGKALQRSEIRSTVLTADARDIHSKYEALQESLKQVAKQREALLAARDKGSMEITAEVVEDAR